MRNKLLYTVVMAVMLTLSGCVSISTTPPTATPVVQTQTTTSIASGNPSSSSSATTTSSATSSATPAAGAPSSSVATSASASTQPSAAVTAAVQAVIQKANDEQVQAFTKNDPTIMQDTATQQYYNELVGINSDMVNGGVSGIKTAET